MTELDTDRVEALARLRASRSGTRTSGFRLTALVAGVGLVTGLYGALTRKRG